jgi:hypothetical protein
MLIAGKQFHQHETLMVDMLQLFVGKMVTEMLQPLGCA